LTTVGVLIVSGGLAGARAAQSYRESGGDKVNRKDWGVNWNAALEAGGILVSEEITLEFEVSAIKES
jgi:polyisoprenoid-binding protein YceI